MIKYVLQSKTANLFWSCNAKYGWTYLDEADLFSYEEMMALSPQDWDGDWRILTEEGLENE